MTAYRASFGLLAMFAVAVISCGPAPNENSRSDVQRAGAQPIPIDRVVTDALNFEGGDATDWKVFEVTDPGTHTIELFWDNRFVLSVVTLHDQYGTQINRNRHDTNGHQQIVLNLNEPGFYYLKIETEQHRSTYSVRVSEGPPVEDQEIDSNPRPEFDRPI